MDIGNMGALSNQNTGVCEKVSPLHTKINL